MKKLIGLINNKSFKIIKTRWILLDENNNMLDITPCLVGAINKYNQNNSLKIPYDFKEGLSEYGFGCGLSHYLNNENINKVNEYCIKDISNCEIDMFTKNDIKNILKCKGVFDINIFESLKEYYKIK